MTLEFVQILSTDYLQLPGLLYLPQKPTKKVAIWLHGMGDGIFYNPARLNALGRALTDKGIALLGFNNRGAQDHKLFSVTKATDRFAGGFHYELIADCQHDIDGAVQFLDNRKFSEYYLLGHSTGANKICVYNQQTPHNPFAKYVLAGAGDDTGLHYQQLGEAKFTSVLAQANKLTAAGQGITVMPEASGLRPYSAQSAADVLDPNGNYNTFPFYEQTTKRLGSKPLFAAYHSIKIPTLVVYGEHDESCQTAGSVNDALIMLEDATQSSIVDDCGFLTISNTDHGFHGAEHQLAAAVADWLSWEVT